MGDRVLYCSSGTMRLSAGHLRMPVDHAGFSCRAWETCRGSALSVPLFAKQVDGNRLFDRLVHDVVRRTRSKPNRRLSGHCVRVRLNHAFWKVDINASNIAGARAGPRARRPGR
jgi:hypothetical protein